MSKSYAQLYANSRKAKTIKSVTPVYYKWKKKGDQVIGAFVSYSPVQSRLGDKEYNQYIFETDSGLVKFALGRSADNEVTPILGRGVVYAITFQGKENIAGGRSVNRFEIEEIGIADQVDETEVDPDPDDKQVNKK